MALKVIGAGFGRTGTLSLKHALETLGFVKCYHMMEVIQNPRHIRLWTEAHQGKPVDWDALFAGYQASVDWPACNLWGEQLEHFPRAKVILTLRDPDRWYESVMNTIYKNTVLDSESPDEKRRSFAAWTRQIIWEPLFGDRMDDRAHAIDVFNRHNETVEASVPSDRLLVFSPGDGWGPLCRFLSADIPEEDYPHVNTTAQFTESVLKSRSKS